ncbi:hypothetical protein DFH07DRAFT_454733 [Mycena maculata]|uniref:F-box domain-containing protein n=1 Tax=Mycena maculata TaxID=230809 RepID=A0AAD7J7X9_9AGAR|nr:hypothetical protein DFH07DRAFT_454733 [Mycena maculata]
MHRCLLVSEIFSLITDFSLDGTLHRKTGVYRLALTCKAFSEPALDALWREIDGVLDLIHLLPEYVWDTDEGNSEATSCMARETTEFDWSRFFVHAQRVRKLTFSSFSRKDLLQLVPSKTENLDGNTVLRHIHQQCPHPKMLPNLLSLSWHDDVENIDIFICPTLRNLALYSSVNYPGFIELLNSNAPIITALTIDRWTNTSVPDAVIDAVSLATTRMEHLEAFHCGFNIRSNAFQYLSPLSQLRHMCAPLHSVDDPSFFFPAPTTFFPSITSLVLRRSQSTLLCAFLSAMSSPFLDTIWLEVADTNPSTILDALTILADHPSRDELESVCISAYWDMILGGVPPESVALLTLRPLLTLENVTDLDLAGIWWLDLGDEDLEEMAASMPQLTALALGTSDGLIIHPRITPRGLIPLFYHCTLERLGLVIDVGDNVPDSAFELPRTRTRATRHARRLRFLVFGNSRIGPTKVAATATFLSELVPCLTTLTAWSENTAHTLPDPIPHPPFLQRIIVEPSGRHVRPTNAS